MTPSGQEPPRAGPIDVVSSAQPPTCPRCGAEGLLAARVPHTLDRPDGHRVHGTTVVVLCPSCDAGHPTGGPLITFFHVHGSVDDDTVTQAAELIAAWVASISIPPPDADQIDAETEAWYRGDL